MVELRSDEGGVRRQVDRPAPIPAAADGSETARAVLAVLNNASGEKPSCPSCTAVGVQRWGFTDGLQRFRCKACQRSFTPLTGTPLARLRRRDLWLEHAQILHEGSSIRVAARRLGVHRNTSLRWRHRWLTNPRDLRAEVFAGPVEVDTVRLQDIPNGKRAWQRVGLSEPLQDDTTPCAGQRERGGRCMSVLVVCDHNGAVADAVLPRIDVPSLTSVLGPLLDPQRAVFCSPGAPSFRAFAAMRCLPHFPQAEDAAAANASASAPGRAGRSQLGHARAYIARLRQWMRRFRGVSIGFLPNYLGWRRLLDRTGDRLTPQAWLRIAIGRDDQQATVTMSSTERGGAKRSGRGRGPGRDRENGPRMGQCGLFGGEAQGCGDGERGEAGGR